MTARPKRKGDLAAQVAEALYVGDLYRLRRTRDADRLMVEVWRRFPGLKGKEWNRARAIAQELQGADRVFTHLTRAPALPAFLQQHPRRRSDPRQLELDLRPKRAKRRVKARG